MGTVRNKKTMAGKLSPTGKPLPTAGRRGPLPNAHVGRHFPSGIGTGRQKMAQPSTAKGRGLLLPQGSTPTSTGRPIASLALAYQLTQKASKVGFDWPDIQGVLKKLDEELMEFREALRHRDPKRAQEELGDLLFVLANVARFLQINPEQALRKTIQKFISRFHYVEVSLKKRGKSLRQSDLIEMDQLWEEAKHKKRMRD
jgi:tetrapyrrole methylase family protein/MazG family protein